MIEFLKHLAAGYPLMKTAILDEKEQKTIGTSPNQDRLEIPWNFVTKNLVGHELLRKKLREKIGKLQKHLCHFPHDAVHFHIALERHARKPLHSAKLTLRVPSNILHSKKSSPDLIKAFDLAVKALLRELESLKADLRHEADWKRKERRKSLRRELKGTGFADLPQAQGHGPQEQGEVDADFPRHHSAQLTMLQGHRLHSGKCFRIKTKPQVNMTDSIREPALSPGRFGFIEHGIEQLGQLSRDEVRGDPAHQFEDISEPRADLETVSLKSLNRHANNLLR